MIKFETIVHELRRLRDKGAQSEQCYRDAATCLQGEGEKGLFIHWWQEHAKILAELEDKIRWLGGVAPNEERDRLGPMLHFKNPVLPEQISAALMECERSDSSALQDYAYVLQTPIPVDVRILLMLHITKLKAMQARVLGLLIQRHKEEGSVDHRWTGIGVKSQSGDAADRVRLLAQSGTRSNP